MSTAEIIGVILGGLTIIGAVMSFFMSHIVGNNTRAMDRLLALTDKHGCTLEDHEGRIVRIETVQELESR
jgi:hypothetical protein